ncbi:hypothetical protein CDIFMA2_33770 [Clostridioides difficile]|nr:hypothetical protein CDIFMA2_33770 [Clostridioides difficile]
MENKDIMLDEIFINNRFDEGKFSKFAINLLNLEQKDRLENVAIKENSSVYENYIHYVRYIGKYTDESRKTILVLIIKLKSDVDRSRTMQRNYIAKHLKERNADAAIVALYSEMNDIWRISFVKLDYTLNMDGLIENITPAKRYSYLIEPKLKNHTAQNQLKKLLFNDSKKPSLKEIEDVFSVEVVTDEFFKIYRDKYLDLKEFLESNYEFIEESNRLMVEVNEFSEEFAKKLMGQVSFIYFLQKKGWLGAQIVPFKTIDRNEFNELKSKENEDVKEIMDRVFKPYIEDKSRMELDRKALNELSNVEADWLSNVFKGKKYEQQWGEGVKTFLRGLFNSYSKNKVEENFFNSYLEPLFYEALNEKRGINEYYKRFNCKIPFLNGGLFEPIYKYEWEKTNIKIPDYFFSNDEDTGLLDFFDMYNFTMNEDEPLEKEIAVDPEMLGKIFENLLDVKERKSKGAFYTPREIVHYMCQECLINYLNNETNIDTASLEIFIKYGDVIKDIDINIKDKKDCKMPKFITDNLEIIDKALEKVTVVDPAVGSGAFPLGMLNEIVKSRSILVEYMTKDLDKWEKEDFIRSNKKSLYNLKRNAMKKSIFAVDIDPSAVDITKLRLWLSLVVDADTRTVNTLPNLDYNIMVGNSLIEEFNGIKLFDEDIFKEKSKRKNKEISNQISMNIEGTSANIGIEQEYQLLEDIQKLQNKLFDTKETSEKIHIKKDIENKEWDLIEYKLTRECKLSFKERENLKKQRKSNRKPYFLWKLEFSKIFNNNGGFDIVIGNPPYGASLDESIKELLSAKHPEVPDFETSDYFLCKSYEILRSNGISAFIIPNTILANVFAKKLRKLLLKDWDILGIDNLSSIDVFKSATVRTCIPYLVKNKVDKEKYFKLINSKQSSSSIERTIKIKEKIILNDNIDSWLNIFYQDEESIEIIDIIKKDTIKLDEITDISQGLIAYDKYRGHSQDIIKNRIWHSIYKVDNTYKKELQGKDVTRYKLKWNGKNWLSYGDWLAAPRKKEFFTEERILIREITNPTIMACYTKEEFYNSPSIINIINFKNVSPYYILAVLNSTLISYYHNKTSPKANKGAFPKILVNDVRKIPIKVCKNMKLLNEIIELSKCIIEEENLERFQNLSLKIDSKICEVYGINRDHQSKIKNFFENGRKK